MNVQASESIREGWAALEGHVVNSALPLYRFLGRSDHSGVFLTELKKRQLAEVALKLVPVVPAAESQLARWRAHSDLLHPHLLPLFEAGWCELDGLHYLYAVMEYADQNLAQLLAHRAMTEDEAREMLVPTLSALAFLHEKNLVQNQLKPSNILVVGDQLKLASDTIHPFGAAVERINATSVYDPPEARDGICSTASDIWALGVTLFEALTRSHPPGVHDGRGSVMLPPDVSPAFREMIARCLSRKAYDRPKVADLQAWLGVKSTEAPQAAAVAEASKAAGVAEAPKAPAVAEAPVPEAPVPEAPVPKHGLSVSVMPEIVTTPAQSPAVSADASDGTSARKPTPRSIPLLLAALAVLGLTWAGVRMLKTSKPPIPPAVEAPSDTAAEVLASPSQSPIEAAAVVPNEPASSEPAPVSEDAAAAQSAEVHEEIPDVPSRALRTIRGHVRVSVRVIVDGDGTVFAALTDDPGPSRYFERLAIDAAKKWKFVPTDSGDQRVMVLRFDFTRQGATARAATP